MSKFRSKPTEIEAVQWDGWDSDEAEEFAPEHVRTVEVWVGDEERDAFQRLQLIREVLDLAPVHERTN